MRWLLLLLLAATAEAQTPTPACIAYYNGQATGTYSIGRATKATAPCTGLYSRYAGNPVLSGSGVPGAFDEVLVYQPSVVTEGGVTYLFYQGDAGSNARTIGRVRSTDGGLTFSVRTAVLSPGGGWEGSYVFFPTVISDPTDPDPAQRCKMWYAGFDGSKTRVGYAYAPSCGASFTKYVGNPVLSPGAPATWEDTAVIIGSVTQSGGTWYAYYGGQQNTNVMEAGLATFTDPKSTYTKSGLNPILPNRPSAKQTLSSSWFIGSSTVTVPNATAFQPGEIVFVVDTLGRQFNRVVSASGTSVQLRDAATRTYSTVNAASLRSVFWNAILPSAVWYDGNYHMSVVGFIIAGDLNQLLEWVGYATAPSLAALWSYDFASGAFLEPPTGGWDLDSSENMRLLGVPATLAASTQTPIPTATPTPTRTPGGATRTPFSCPGGTG